MTETPETPSPSIEEQEAELKNRPKLKSEYNPLAWLVWIVGFVLSVLAAYLAVRSDPSSFPFLAAVCHLVATVVTGAGMGLALSLSDSAGWGWASLGAFFTFTVGPVGVLISVICYLMARGQPTGMPLVEVVKAEMWIRGDDEEEGELVPLDYRLREELRTEPLVDLLPYADVTTAIAIINQLKERGKKRDLQLLRQMTQDKRPEVYQYALAQLDRLVAQYSGPIFALTRELRAFPHRTELRVDLAKLYLEYRDSGLLDESLEDYYWELTLGHVLEAMLSHSHGDIMAIDLARLLHEAGLVEEAIEVAEPNLKKEPGNLKGQLLLLQSLVEKGQSEDPRAFNEARRYALEKAWAVRVPKHKTAGDETFDLGNFWFKGRAKRA